jgi:hypothetical protein
LPWHNPYRFQDKAWNPCDTESWIAAKTYQALMQGKEITGRSFKKMIKSVKAKDNLEHGKKNEIMKWSEEKTARTVDLFDLKKLGLTDEFINGKKEIDNIKAARQIGTYPKASAGYGRRYRQEAKIYRWYNP